MASGGTIRDLPPEVLEQLHSLDLELEEGDITKKGYEKKRAQLLQPYTIDEAVDDNTPDTSNATSAVNDHDESIAEETRQAETMPFDLDGEPSAADVTDFLDYLPSPTHSPTRPEVGAALMEENHQQLVQQQQQTTGMEGGATMLSTQSPSSHSPPPRPAGYPWQQQQQQAYGYGQYYAPAASVGSPRPGYQYDPRMMSRPPYQQQQPRPMYGHYPGQQRPPPFARPAPPPPPPSNSPYTPRPMYNPAPPRPMPQQPVRPMYRPVPPQPRPMATYPPPRPPNMPPSSAAVAAPNRHARTSSLESRSDANSMMQPPPPGSVIRPTYPMNGSHSDYDMQSRGDDWGMYKEKEI